MILQIDKRLERRWHKTGCYLASIAFLANKKANTPLSTEILNEMLIDWQRRRFIKEDLTVLNPTGIFASLGLIVEYTDKHEPPDRETQEDEVEVLKFVHPDGREHFVAGDGHGHVAYDPYGDSETVKEGTLESKRIFKVLARV